MRQYLMTAYSESGIKLFIRFVHLLEEALKTAVNHPFASKIAWIEYRGHKYMISDIYRLLDRAITKRARNNIKRMNYAK